MNVEIDITDLEGIQEIIELFEPGEEHSTAMLREIANTVLGEQLARIHQRGEKSDNSKIGTYSDQYMKVRLKKGLTADREVILVFKNNMQSDYGILILDDSVGLGFNDERNYKKSKYMEERYGAIYDLNDTEEEAVENIANDYIERVLK
jgi:hypothetical protein